MNHFKKQFESESIDAISFRSELEILIDLIKKI